MFIRSLQVILYILFCIRYGARPWRYFLLNADYFNDAKGIFSKLDIDRLIPQHWRLAQSLDNPLYKPKSYPVFIKPEWGQNASGIQRADNAEQLNLIRSSLPPCDLPYLVQQAAPESMEFEIFIIASKDDPVLTPSISVTRVKHRSGEPYPINSIYNRGTSYEDISDIFNEQSRNQLWKQLKQIGPFNLSRYGLRANSIDDMLAGRFHIIEINLFFPMPLYLLSYNRGLPEKLSFVIHNMRLLARVTKALPKKIEHKPIFFRKLKMTRQVRMGTETRPV